MRESRGHLFPTHFFYSLGIMQACSWQINTRPYEVVVPAELQNMRGTAMNFSAPQFAASYAFKSHDPPSYRPRWWFPTLSKEMLCHDSYRPRGQTFPSGWVTHSYITLVVRYVQSTACLHCAVLLKLWCSTVDLSQCCFTVWPLPKPVTLHEIVYFIPHYEFCELYSDFPGHIRTILTSTTFQSSCSETFIPNS